MSWRAWHPITFAILYWLEAKHRPYLHSREEDYTKTWITGCHFRMYLPQWKIIPSPSTCEFHLIIFIHIHQLLSVISSTFIMNLPQPIMISYFNNWSIFFNEFVCTYSGHSPPFSQSYFFEMKNMFISHSCLNVSEAFKALRSGTKLFSKAYNTLHNLAISSPVSALDYLSSTHLRFFPILGFLLPQGLFINAFSFLPLNFFQLTSSHNCFDISECNLSLCQILPLWIYSSSNLSILH